MTVQNQVLLALVVGGLALVAVVRVASSVWANRTGAFRRLPSIGHDVLLGARVAVVIPMTDGSLPIHATLDAVGRQSRPARRVLVGLSGSALAAEASLRVRARFDPTLDVVVADSPDADRGELLNQLWRDVRGGIDHLMVLDAGVILDERSIEHGLRHFQRDAAVSSVAAKVDVPGDPPSRPRRSWGLTRAVDRFALDAEEASTSRAVPSGPRAYSRCTMHRAGPLGAIAADHGRVWRAPGSAHDITLLLDLAAGGHVPIRSERMIVSAPETGPFRNVWRRHVEAWTGTVVSLAGHDGRVTSSPLFASIAAALLTLVAQLALITSLVGWLVARWDLTHQDRLAYGAAAALILVAAASRGPLDRRAQGVSARAQRIVGMLLYPVFRSAALVVGLWHAVGIARRPAGEVGP